MSHRHVCFSELHPSVIQSRLEGAGVQISEREDGQPRSLLADGRVLREPVVTLGRHEMKQSPVEVWAQSR